MYQVVKQFLIECILHSNVSSSEAVFDRMYHTFECILHSIKNYFTTSVNKLLNVSALLSLRTGADKYSFLFVLYCCLSVGVLIAGCTEEATGHVIKY